MVDSEIMCRKHLLGEHVELHMFVGSINRGIKMDGYIKNNLLEFQSITIRHNELVNEMINRGYKHKSDLLKIKVNVSNDIFNSKVNKLESKKELLNRCSECKNS